MVNQKRKRGNKGKIVKDSSEFVEYNWQKGTSQFKTVPHSKTKGSGVYALYDNYGLYYVGLSNRSIRSRLRAHTRDKHKGKWLRFSWYHVPDISSVKDLETILQRIFDPRGNLVQGKFRTKHR